MDHEQKIRELDARERELTRQTVDGARSGAVSDALRGELAEVRAALKAARRVATMDAKRTEPKLTRKISFLLPESEYQDLAKRAAESGTELSTFIRSLLRA